MPLCTSCAQSTRYLYTIYQSAGNIKLEQCPSCHEFADPYVQHDTLTLLLDLILLKRDVYRHLLFNRGTGARTSVERIGDDEREHIDSVAAEDGKGFKKQVDKETEQARWQHIVGLGFGLIWVDAFIRWTHLNIDTKAFRPDLAGAPWSSADIVICARVVVGCFIETLAFHAAITAACYAVLTFLDYIRSRKTHPSPISSIRQQFRISHIPLTILYSSLPKLFLLFLLSIWKPSSTPTTKIFYERTGSAAFRHPVIIKALEVFDDDKLDKEWIVRNILGGMAAGFGLRVVLDCHPIFTTLIILFGWGVKTSVAWYVSQWVGGAQRIGEIWLAYSIP